MSSQIRNCAIASKAWTSYRNSTPLNLNIKTPKNFVHKFLNTKYKEIITKYKKMPFLKKNTTHVIFDFWYFNIQLPP